MSLPCLPLLQTICGGGVGVGCSVVDAGFGGGWISPRLPGADPSAPSSNFGGSK